MLAAASIVGAIATTTASAAPFRLPVTADTTICAYPEEREFAPGKAARLKLKGIENVILIDADWTPLKGLRVTRAALHLKGTETAMTVRWVGVSTVAAAWREGTGETMEAKGDGACFPRPFAGGAWAGPESEFLDAVWGKAGTSWSQTVAARAADGWFTIPLEGRLIQACAAGRSHGLALSDDNGQTMNVSRRVEPGSNLSNNFFFSREQAGAAPWIEAEAEPLVPPPEPRAAGDPPRAGAAGVFVIPDGAKANPLTGNVLEEPGVNYEGTPAGTWRRANPAWSGKERRMMLGALRGEWAACSLVCETSATPATFRVTPGELRGPGGAVIPSAAFRLSRAWYQHAGTGSRGWYADPLVPLVAGEAFRVPDARNAVPGQTTQAVYAEVFVPRDARPGRYEGRVTVDAGGTPLALALALEVGAGELPAAARFVWSLNAYASPGWGCGEPGSTPFLGAERAFYAMAHAHRGTLAILHYSHSGNQEPGAIPPVRGQGAAARVADWSGWDARFGPLFDGSAFAGGGRDGVPLDHFYLGLSENYPVTMAEGYKWNGLRWEDHWKTAGSVEESFSREYREAWVAVASDYLKHIRERGWRTQFQVYLNDKYFYKQYDLKTKAWGKGTSFWLLDEPQHIQDFQALAFFGRLLRRAQAGDRSRVVFRVDVSRPEWGRDTLDRVADLMVSGAFGRYRRLHEDWRERFGQRVWTYGDLPSATAPASALSAQALDLYARGADGYVPWLVLGGEENWTSFATTCLLYPGKPVGVEGPCASLRLKAIRRAEEDVELLARLTPDRDRSLLDGVLPTAAGQVQLDEQGGFYAKYDAPDPARLEAFRSSARNAVH